MAFYIRGLDPDLFADLHRLDDDALRVRGVERVRVPEKPYAPCRISLDDAEIGQSVLLLNFDHQPAQTPYQQQGPIFVSAGAARFDRVGEIPLAMKRRTLSLRAFDARHMMADADLTEGAEAEALIARLFANPEVAYIHAHYARLGCFAARIDRA